MASIHSDCWRGTLTRERLRHYLAGVDIDTPGRPRNITPLAAACWQGHLRVVLLLLQNPFKHADPNAPSVHGRTPLFYATTLCPPANRLMIVRRLLDAGADPDACSVKDGMNTPLMNAVGKIRDEGVARELLARGASITKRNAEGETAATLAQGTNMEAIFNQDALNGRDSLLIAALEVVISIIILVLIYTNSTRMKDIVTNIADKLYKTAGKKGFEPSFLIAEANRTKKKLIKKSAKQDIPVLKAPRRKRSSPRIVPENKPSVPDRTEISPVPDDVQETSMDAIPTPQFTFDELPLVPSPSDIQDDSFIQEDINFDIPDSWSENSLSEHIDIPADPPEQQEIPPTPNVESVADELEDVSADETVLADEVVERTESVSGFDAIQDIDETPQESVADGSEFSAESTLHGIISSNEQFFQIVAEKAATLAGDPSTSLGSPENISRLTRLALYQSVFYCEDSAAIELGERYVHLRELVKRMARIATSIVPDDYGVEMRFVNAQSAYNLKATQIETVLATARHAGNNPLGSSLFRRILQPLAQEIILNRNTRLERPLLVNVIIGSGPTGERTSTFRDVVVKFKRHLTEAGYNRTAVVYNICQVGDDAGVKDFIRGLKADREIGDVVYCVAERLDEEYRRLRSSERRLDEWLLKVLTAPLVGRGDI
ncbi:hypothetical protein NM688_g9208 [Phlebia brevispora]|uniref:Uncharacterized protein n=1 Tax=Phlebia brevispora TaxID=194682 RepID=A0ACC1RKU2_9APHY|nr:hypothetical protein NM688_g9208 [Phlebia brevispora]